MDQRWIWPFELLDKLGEGGMGVVYRARYVVDDRHFAVKLLPPDVANATILSRFERELEILKTLRHPNIVRCFGGVCESKQRFYAMELVEGGTLDRLLEDRGKLPWEQVIQFALQMASGLAYAHERGVVHRDVKPGNFLMTPAGKLKLSDFGLATVVAAAKITAAGKTMGTFPYMAPEQIRGRPPVSAQTDLYSLGCVIFEMLTGRTPFIGDTPAEVMHKHLEDVPPRISEFAPDVPASLENLVRDLLQKDMEDRPESAVVVAQRLMDSTGVEVAAPKRKAAEGKQFESTTVASRGIPVGTIEPPREEAVSSWNWLLPVVTLLLAISLIVNLRYASTQSDANPAEDLWIASFKENQPDIKRKSAEALVKIGQTSPKAIQALTDALSDESTATRQLAINSLKEVGDAAKPALTELIRVQNRDDNELLRRSASEAITAIRAAGGTVGGRSMTFWIVTIVIAVAAAFGGWMLLRE